MSEFGEYPFGRAPEVLRCGVVGCTTPLDAPGYWGPTRYNEVFMACATHGPLLGGVRYKEPEHIVLTGVEWGD